MERNSQGPGTVLMVMDIMANILGRVKDREGLLTQINAAIAAARAAQIPIIYVVVGFRKGLPEVSDANKAFAAIKGNPSYAAGLEQPGVDPSVAPQPGDIIVTKRRYSAFTGSDLEVILRAHRAEHLVLTGISTSGVVLSTLREAADKDYRLSVLSDGCADPDDEVHTVLVTKVFPRQAEVLTTGQWVGRIAK